MKNMSRNDGDMLDSRHRGDMLNQI